MEHLVGEGAEIRVLRLAGGRVVPAAGVAAHRALRHDMAHGPLHLP